MNSFKNTLVIGQSPFLRFLEEDLLSVGEVESPGQDSESLSSPSSNPPLVDVTLSDWCIICKHLESLAYPQPQNMHRDLCMIIIALLQLRVLITGPTSTSTNVLSL